MSKKNNMNPGNYYGGDRNHQGEGILQDRNKQELAKDEAERQHGTSGQPNFTPVGESDKKD